MTRRNDCGVFASLADPSSNKQPTVRAQDCVKNFPGEQRLASRNALPSLPLVSPFAGCLPHGQVGVVPLVHMFSLVICLSLSLCLCLCLCLSLSLSLICIDAFLPKSIGILSFLHPFASKYKKRYFESVPQR